MKLFDRFHPQRRRRFVSVALLLAIASCGIIFRIPKTVVKDRSIPFPCMDCACSCSNATACWNKCCCLSDGQKLNWAEEHHITPPAWFLTRLEADTSQLCLVETTDEAERKSCLLCRAAKSLTNSTTGPNAAKILKAEASLKVAVRVLAITDRRCNGMDSLFALISLAMACRFDAPWRPEIVIASAIDQAVVFNLGIAFPPPSPPPQCCVA